MRSETVRGALRDGGRQPLSGGKGRMVLPHSTRRTPRSTTSISAKSPDLRPDFLSTPADICIYGDAAGGGKTVGLILELLRMPAGSPV